MASSLVISELMGLLGIKAPHLGPQPTHWLKLLEIDRRASDKQWLSLFMFEIHETSVLSSSLLLGFEIDHLRLYSQ